MALRGILFDKDGTLLDFEASWSRLYRELALDLAQGNEASARAMLASGGLDEASGRYRPGAVLSAGNTLDITRHWFPALSGRAFDEMVARIDRAFHANGVRYSVPVAGLADTLVRLDRMGFAMGVATSDGTEGTRAALKMLQVDRHLPHVFGYDSVPQPKPGADMVHAFAKAIDASADEIAVVGDNVHDLEMARNAGAGAAIGVLTGNSTAADLGPHADAVLASIRDLPEWLAGRTS